jgi:hypothetical protein
MFYREALNDSHSSASSAMKPTNSLKIELDVLQLPKWDLLDGAIYFPLLEPAMSKSLAGVLIFLVPTMAWAIPVWPTMDTATYVAKSSDILIVRCINPNVRGEIGDGGLMLVEVEVISIVKGDRKVGKSRLATIRQPMEAGKRYLMASFGGNAFDTGFIAQSDQAVVEVPSKFDLKSLAGETAVQQVQAIFDARRAQVERLLQQLQDEKKMLDQTVPKIK